MKYVYINQEEDRVVFIGKAHSADHAQDLEEYVVADNFDMSKEVGDENGNKVQFDNAITATEFLARYNADYVQKRITAYPSIEDQLDKIYHEGIDAWKEQIAAIKARYPKPT
jgi:hypothetical protein